ncbi:MAG: cytidylate kinase-like family protein, partial [Muribaculaceae bacterium]|nr:cytidylate kinase-like family protein [Muribaculaceae bacterium]
IVIGRQFGCGGRKIGRKIAEAFNIPYYDKTLLSKAAEECGMDPEIFRAVDEKRPSFLRNFLGLSCGTSTAPCTPGSFSHLGPGSLAPESLYDAQSEVIRSICRQGSCVIVGRTADYVMRHHPGLISIFIQAPIEHRVKEIIDRKDAKSEVEASALAKKHDKERESYYNYFTNRSWGTAGNYHLCFDSSRFDADAIIALLKSYIGKR